MIAENNSISEIFKKWYRKNKRDLPWRNSLDPYNIWISEIILQQTRVEQGIHYYDLFLARFPNIQSLAESTEEQVLKSWEGMGYYSRARNIHKTARIIAREHDGLFPKEQKDLEKLPGIGPYTSAAIASISFRKNVLAIDGNVIRVISRIYGIKGFRTEKTFLEAVEKKAKKIYFDPAADFNQALMDFGSSQCIPKKPDCESCIFKDSCFSYMQTSVEKFPQKKKSKISRERFLIYLVIEQKGRFWIRKRLENDIWANLYEFPKVEKKEAIPTIQILNEIGISPKFLKEETGFIKHILSHQIINANFLILHHDTILTNGIKNSIFGESQANKEIQNLPFPRLITNFLKERYTIYGRSK